MPLPRRRGAQNTEVAPEACTRVFGTDELGLMDQAVPRERCWGKEASPENGICEWVNLMEHPKGGRQVLSTTLSGHAQWV